MMTHTTVVPNDVELVHRLHRVAKMVVRAVDSPPSDGAVFALAMWEAITGTTDADTAIRYAHRVADPTWPATYLEAAKS